MLIDHTHATFDQQMTQVTKLAVKTSPGTVFSVVAYNFNAALRYFQLHNKASAPAATNVPVLSYPIPGGTAANPGSIVLDDTHFTKQGYKLTTGIAWAVSTTYGTFTDSATASEHVVIVAYV